VKVRDLRTQCAAVSLLLVLLSAAGSFAQQPADAPKPPETAATIPVPEFEVVSVKELKFDGGGYSSTWRWDPNGVTAMNVSLNSLICMAYKVSFYQISGGPEWGGSGPVMTMPSLFQVEARMDDATVEALKKLPSKEADAIRERMLQAVLADRFKLKVRRETRPFPAYALVVAKGGPSLKEAAPEDPKADTAATPAAPGNRGNLNMTFEDGALVITGKAIPISSLAGQLTGMVQGKVKDETGLKGVYDIKIRYAPDNGLSGTSDTSAPTIFTALQEQLGLKLESKKEPDEAVIVEHAEKPSQN